MSQSGCHSFANLQARIEVLEAEPAETSERQTATAEVLRVIKSSPGKIAPVFEATLERVPRVLEAAFGGMYTSDGELARLVAFRTMPPLAFGGEPLAP